MLESPEHTTKHPKIRERKINEQFPNYMKGVCIKVTQLPESSKPHKVIYTVLPISIRIHEEIHLCTMFTITSLVHLWTTRQTY